MMLNLFLLFKHFYMCLVNNFIGECCENILDVWINLTIKTCMAWSLTLVC